MDLYTSLMARYRHIFEAWQARLAAALIVIFLIVGWIYAFDILPPKAFPADSIVAVPDGASLSSTARLLAADHVVSSPFWFVNFVLFLNGEKRVVGGDYYFA